MKLPELIHSERGPLGALGARDSFLLCIDCNPALMSSRVGLSICLALILLYI